MGGVAVQTWWIAIAFIVFSGTILATIATKSDYYHEHIQHHTDVILLGATGDLAKRYLWNGFFNLYTKESIKNSSPHVHTHNTFMFYACALSPKSKAEPLLAQIIDSQVKCVDPVLLSTCQDHVYAFKKRIKYFQLHEETQYKKLCQILNQYSSSDKHKRTKIFYLAIPPSSYRLVAERIAKYCRQSTTDGENVKLVIEKPIGTDLNSAQNLSSILEMYFNEEEIYRIDHYLGKSVVQNILPFRSAHDDIEHLLNRENVASIDVVVKETDGVACTDRTTFYNGIGVIRDMLQNHMMELLTLITMDMPANVSNVEDIRTAKLHLLHSIRPVSIDDIALGQYTSYQRELQAASRTDSQDMSVTPTLAMAQLTIHSPRWAGVPVIFLSGKKLDCKISYVRVKFKHRKLPLTSFELNLKLDQIIFHIGGAGLNTPAVIISHGLSDSLCSNCQRKSADTNNPDICKLAQLYDEDCDTVIVFKLTSMYSAHSVLIDDIFHGKKQNFISKDHLLALWEVWTPVLHDLTKANKLPVLYDMTGEQGQSKHSMYYYNAQSNVIESLGYVQEDIYIDQFKQNINFASTVDNFLSSKLITGEQDHVITSLAKHLQEQAVQTIAQKGSFHVAFSGGKSPVKLFKYLSRHHFPWQHSHVWLVDERCVSLNDPLSNFHSLETNLLSYVNVPFTNVHPMPVDINGQLCDESSQGDMQYSQALNYWLSGAALDFVILGVGDDGHIASLFPRQPILTSQSNVTYAGGGPENNVPKRMTMTYQSINSASYIAILMTGTSKHSVIHKLQNERLDSDEFPVVGVQGNITWYIDYAAYLGH